MYHPNIPDAIQNHISDELTESETGETLEVVNPTDPNSVTNA